jgi:hypothetical protein
VKQGNDVAWGSPAGRERKLAKPYHDGVNDVDSIMITQS